MSSPLPPSSFLLLFSPLFFPPTTFTESNFFHILFSSHSGQDESSVAEGKILALDLLDAVTTEYEKARGFSGNGPRGGPMGNFGPAGNGWGGMGGQGGMRMGGMIPGPPGGGGDLPPPPPEEEQPRE